MDQKLRNRRQSRIRARIVGTSVQPRASVHRSLKYISVQLIDDTSHRTVASARGALKKANAVGKEAAARAQAAGVKKIAFDRGGYRYHGRVKSLAEGMREGGLKF
ncbi:MAG: 50S ribosomal protein L18 [Patescibacteria group bacterium]